MAKKIRTEKYFPYKEIIYCKVFEIPSSPRKTEENFLKNTSPSCSVIPTILPGCVECYEGPGPEPCRAGDDRHDQRGGCQRSRVLPRLLQAGAEEVQGGEQGAPQSNFLQSNPVIIHPK